MSESFADLFEESLNSSEMAPGSIVTGTVVEIDSEWVVVHAGLKSEGVIPRIQFVDDNGEFKLKIGDRVKVAMEVVDDGWGETRLSREKARRAESWMMLEEAFEKNAVVAGIINGKVKGGFTVDINDIRAFSGSLADIRPLRETAHLEGKPLEFKVIKLDQRRNNVAASRRAVLEQENSAERDAAVIAAGRPGSQGVKLPITARSSISAASMVCCTSPIWRRRIRHPSEMVNVGDEVVVKF
jgi:small subunit ribosomal protein S1